MSKVILANPETTSFIPPELLIDAEVIIHLDFPDGVLNIYEREDYDWMLHMQEHGPPAEIQRWIDFGESLRHELGLG